MLAHNVGSRLCLSPLNRREKARNIRLIALYRIFSRMYFYLPVIFPIFYVAGQNVPHIECLLALYGIAIVISLGSAKRLTQFIGHKKALIVGECLKIIALAMIMFVAGNIILSGIAQLIMGFGYAMIVGNDTVILQYTFDHDNSAAYHSIQSRTNSYMFTALLFSGLAGALLFQISIPLVLALSIVAAIASIISVSAIRYDAHDTKKSFSQKPKRVQNVAAAYYYINRGLTLATFVGVLPYFFFVLTHASMTWFAIILSSFTLTGYLSSKYLTDYVKNHSLATLSLLSTLLMLAALALLFFHNMYLGFLTTVTLGLVSGCIRPVTISHIDPKVFNVENTLKKAEFYYGIFNAAILLLAAILFHFSNFNTYLLSLILLSALIGLINTFFTTMNKRRNT